MISDYCLRHARNFYSYSSKMQSKIYSRITPIIAWQQHTIYLYLDQRIVILAWHVHSPHTLHIPYTMDTRFKISGPDHMSRRAVMTGLGSTSLTTNIAPVEEPLIDLGDETMNCVQDQPAVSCYLLLVSRVVLPWSVFVASFGYFFSYRYTCLSYNVAF